MRLKNLGGKPIEDNICGLLQMVSELDTRQWVSKEVECHNRTLDGSGLAIVRHSLSNEKWSKPIGSYVAYGQTTYARASGLGLKESFRKQGQRDFWKRRYISKQESNTAAYSI